MSLSPGCLAVTAAGWARDGMSRRGCERWCLDHTNCFGVGSLTSPRLTSLNMCVILMQGLMVAFRVEDLPMESQMLTDALDTAQKRVENYFFDIRK